MRRADCSKKVEPGSRGRSGWPLLSPPSTFLDVPPGQDSWVWRRLPHRFIGRSVASAPLYPPFMTYEHFQSLALGEGSCLGIVEMWPQKGILACALKAETESCCSRPSPPPPLFWSMTSRWAGSGRCGADRQPPLRRRDLGAGSWAVLRRI